MTTYRHDERSARPPGYCGRILNGNYSEEVKARVVACCRRYHAFEECGTPAIPYIAAWLEKSDAIWYEYASQRLADLLDCQLTDVAQVLRNSVIDRRIYRYTNAKAGKQMLEHLGYKITAVTNSPEALVLFQRQSHHFDLVITDYTMPRMTGVELARKMLRIRPDIPIILSTGFNERITGEKAREIGIRAFVMKPFTAREIAEIVRRVLDKE